MRYRDFKLTEDELFELKMSPTNLARLAKNIDARVGMEFELIVPGVEGDNDEYESEPDYDMDERFPTGPGWHRDVIAFFRGGSMGSTTGYIQRAIDELNENFYDWVGEREEEFMGSNKGQARAREIAYDNIDKDAYDTEEELIKAVQDYIDENESEIRDQLIDEFRDDLDSMFEEWLDDVGINYMSDFANEHSLDWPYWTEPESYGGGDNLNVNDIADDFSQAVGAPVNASSSYHGARREPGRWVVEPDGSLEGDEGESGLEFVSPPLTVPEMMAAIDKVAKWAGRVGAYTNDSTGLHMNVSVPDQQNLDYVKLAMFLGDDYILEQFGREGNSYAKSALKKIKTQAASNPDRVEEMLRQFQGGLNQLASKIVHTGSTDKYTSINNRGGWIEFRGPGGDWLGTTDDLNKVKNTMLRTVVALDVATKPEEFKQEYYKKLYKTLSQGSEDDTIQYFARAAAGELPRAALKSFVRQIQQQRKISKEKPDQVRQINNRNQVFSGVWEVVSRNTEEVVHRFSGEGMNDPRSVAEAEAKAAIWRNRSGFDDPTYVRPLMQPADAVAGSTQDLARQRLAAQMPRHEPFDGNWEVYSVASNNTIYRFIANTEEEAVRAFNIWQDAIRNPSMPREGFNLRAVRPTSIVTGEPVSAGSIGQQQDYRVTYTVNDGTNTEMHSLRISAANANAAMDRVRTNVESHTGNRVESIEAEPIAAPAWRGQQTQSPARGTESLPPGNIRWLILDRNGREVYSFINTTAQRDANEYARNWMVTQASREVRDSGPFEIVPAR